MPYPTKHNGHAAMPPIAHQAKSRRAGESYGAMIHRAACMKGKIGINTTPLSSHAVYKGAMPEMPLGSSKLILGQRPSATLPPT